MAPLVLVADDFEDTRRIYSDYLRFAGFRVASAKDGAEAVAKGQQELFRQADELMRSKKEEDQKGEPDQNYTTTSFSLGGGSTGSGPIPASTGSEAPPEIKTAPSFTLRRNIIYWREGDKLAARQIDAAVEYCRTTEQGGRFVFGCPVQYDTRGPRPLTPR